MVGWGPDDFRSRHGGIHGNPMYGNQPCKQLPTGCHTEPEQWENTRQKGLKHLKGREGWELDLLASQQIELQQPARIRKKHMLIDLLQSAWIQMDSQKHRSKLLICHNQLESKTLAIDPQQSAKPAKIGLNTKCHACKREVPSAWHHPASCHMCLGVIHWPQKTQTHD